MSHTPCSMLSTATSSPTQDAPQRRTVVLSAKEVKLGLAQLESRNQLLVFLEGALGIRQGELGALRWLDCEFENMNFSVQHSYYRRRGWAPEEQGKLVDAILPGGVLSASKSTLVY